MNRLSARRRSNLLKFNAGAACFALLAVTAFAIVDSNNNGVSDPWEKQFNSDQLFPPAFNPLADPDGDGWTNAQEAAAGTNPFDPNPPNGFLRPDFVHSPETWADLDGDGNMEHTPEAVTLTWVTIPGKQYTLQCSLDLTEGSWLPIGGSFTGSGNEVERGFPITESEGVRPDKNFWRVAVTDIDTDDDGLTDNEEKWFGSSIYLPDTNGDGIDDIDSVLDGDDPSDEGGDKNGDGIPDNVLYSVVFEIAQQSHFADASFGYGERKDLNARYFTSETTLGYSVSDSPAYDTITNGEYKYTKTFLANGVLTASPAESVVTTGQQFNTWAGQHFHQPILAAGEYIVWEQFQTSAPAPVTNTVNDYTETISTVTQTQQWKIKLQQGNYYEVSDPVVHSGTATIVNTTKIKLSDLTTYSQVWEKVIKPTSWDDYPSSIFGPLHQIDQVIGGIGQVEAAKSVRSSFRYGSFGVSANISSPDVYYNGVGRDERLKSMRWRWVRFNPHNPFEYTYSAPPASFTKRFSFPVTQHDNVTDQTTGVIKDVVNLKENVEVECVGSEGVTTWHNVPITTFANNKIENPVDLNVIGYSGKAGYSVVSIGNLSARLITDLNNDGKITFADDLLRNTAMLVGASESVVANGTEFLFHNDRLSNGIWDKEDTDPAKPATENDDDDAEQITIDPSINAGEVWLDHPAIAGLSFYKNRQCNAADKINLSSSNRFIVSSSNPFPSKLFVRADVEDVIIYPPENPQVEGDLVLKIKVGPNGQEIEAAKMKLTVVKEFGAKKYFHAARDYIFENNTKVFTQDKDYGLFTTYRIVAMREESTIMSGLDTYDHSADTPRLRGIDEVKANYSSDVIINGNQCFSTNIGGYPFPGSMTNRCDGRLCVGGNILRPPSDDTHNPNLGGPTARYVGYKSGEPETINGQVVIPSEFTFSTGQIPEASLATPDQGLGGLAAKYDRAELQQSENQAVGRGPVTETGRGIIFTATTYVGTPGDAINFADDAHKSGVMPLSGGNGSQWELLFLDGSSSVGLVLANPDGVQKTLIKGGKHNGGFNTYYINTYLLFDCKTPRNP